MYQPPVDFTQILKELEVRPVTRDEEPRYQELMAQHHYLGALPKIGESIWYVALWRTTWLALIGFSAAALKCAARDRWIGWDFRTQYDRLQLVANNSRFLILPDAHFSNFGSRVLALAERRLSADWQARYGHPLWLLETFVDPSRFHGGVYRAANWLEVGRSSGYRRTREGYSAEVGQPKLIFVRPLRTDAQVRLNHPDRSTLPLTNRPKLMLSAAQMQSLPDFFACLPDPRRPQGRRHRLAVVLGLAAGATLCGMEGYKAMHQWVSKLGQQALERFSCRKVNGKYIPPSLSIIRDCLVRTDPDAFDNALSDWSAQWNLPEEALAMDGKTMKQATDKDGNQTHIMSVIGHQSSICYAQKK